LRCEKLDFVQHHFDVFALLVEKGLALLELSQERFELVPLVFREIVKVEQLLDFLQAEAQTLASQRELQTHSIPLRKDAARAFPGRVQQSFVLVMANCASGHSEFPREVRYSICRAHLCYAVK
jgi:hypothetical protein